MALPVAIEPSPLATPTATPNTTTPTPSLNRLSPATSACSSAGSPIRRSMAVTETGSVGARIAPSTMHQTSGTGRSTSGNTSHIPAPNSAIASSVPASASASTATQRARSARRSTCSAAANSRNDSTVPSRVRGRSTVPSRLFDSAFRSAPGSSGSIASSASEASSEISSTPMVLGSRSVRWLRMPNTADSVSSSAKKPSGVIAILAEARALPWTRQGLRPWNPFN